MKEHQCTKCGEVKPLTSEFFSVRKDTSFGYRKQCKDCCKSRGRKYYHDRIDNPDFKEMRRQKSIQWRKDNPEHYLELARNRYYKNREKEIERRKKYSRENKDKINKRVQNRRKNDPLYKLRQLMYSRLRKKIKNKSESMSDILGCTWEEFRIHIESQFKDGMTWDNHGQYGWHLDHIIPLSSAKTEEEIYKLNHYTNLQPLWAEENLKKSDKIFDFSEIV